MIAFGFACHAMLTLSPHHTPHTTQANSLAIEDIVLLGVKAGAIQL